MFMGSQKIPWFGKRQLRGAAAQAQSDAACQDVADLRLRLAESAANALFDLYLVRRETEINAANTGLMRDFRSIALARYESTQVTQQDVLQADLELADLEARTAELARQQSVAIARINTLLHRPADCPLPPPANLSPPCNLPPVEALRDMALCRRPDLAAQSARIRAEEANVDLACKQYYPDLEIVGKYDAFMPEEMRPQLGMNLNVPLWQHKRSAAWREAMAKLETNGPNTPTSPTRPASKSNRPTPNSSNPTGSSASTTKRSCPWQNNTSNPPGRTTPPAKPTSSASSTPSANSTANGKSSTKPKPTTIAAKPP